MTAKTKKNTSAAYRAVGRRKRAIARVIITPGQGKRTVNGRSFADYFQTPTKEVVVNQPFSVLENSDEWDVRVNVNGGGIAGQAEAVKLGISRALVLFNEENRRPLRAAGLLTRDSRSVLRKVYGRAKARKRYQFSKR